VQVSQNFKKSIEDYDEAIKGAKIIITEIDERK